MQNNMKFLTSIFLLLAALSYYFVSTSKTTIEQEKNFIPELQSQVNDIDAIQISRNNQQISLYKKEDSWRIVEANNFIADANIVASLLLSLRKFKLKEKKTKNPKNYDKLSLSETGKHAATKIILSKSGKIVSHVAIGKEARNGQGTYVKENLSSQTWLSQGNLKIKLDIKNWIVNSLFDVEINQIKSVAFNSTETESFFINKLTPKDQVFAIESLPEDKQLIQDYDLDNLANGLKKFTIETIHDITNLPLSSILTITYQLFNGVEYHLEFYQKDNQYLMTVNMANVTNGYEFEKQLNKWAYVIPSYKFDTLNIKLTDIIEDLVNEELLIDNPVK